MVKSLKALIISTFLFSTLVTYGILFITSYLLYEKNLKEKIASDSQLMANQTFNSMFQIMRKGWTRDELNEFLNSLKTSESSEINIYRGKIVESLYGKITQKEVNKDVLEAFTKGETLFKDYGENFTYLFPLKAKTECLKCHTNAKVGDVLGVIEIKNSLTKELDKAKKGFLLNIVFILPISLILSYAFTRYIVKKLKYLNQIKNDINNLNKFSDVSKININKLKTGISEFDEIITNLNLLLDRIKNVAVDKEVLEFEVKLLERFIITSEVLKNWKEYISNMLLEINKIISTYALFAMFKQEDETLLLEIFWLKNPSEKLKESFIDKIKELLKNHSYFADNHEIKVVNNVVNKSEDFNGNEEHFIDIQIKSLILDVAKISGIVGVGLQIEVKNDKTKVLVVESLLSTLVNVIGSVKAIYKYTKDLEYYATRDPLTNLYNQRMFWELIEYEKSRADRKNYKFSLIIIDLDNFKTINDTYGHNVGDRFLREFALVLESVKRKGDILARYGGDEFALILPEADLEQAVSIYQRILSEVEKFSITVEDKKKIKATMSAGLAVYPDHAKDVKDLFIFADNMMYKAKNLGKNNIAIPTEEDILQIYKKVGELNLIILQAIENKDVIPYFQPIIDVKTGKIAAYEVLSRIRYKDRIISAGEFIETAEKMGVIHKLDNILFENAVKKAKESGFDGLLFINLSPKAIILNEYLKNIKSVTKLYGYSPEKIVFELTERETVKNISLLEKFVRELKDTGFKFAIDDFGSGFSSFHYIKRFPIDIIKIEGEFIKSMTYDNKDKIFVLTIQTLAKNMGIKTVAEYIENEDILKTVKELGIDYAQGYYIGKPLPELKI